jgi:hypothetical protein
MRTRKLAIGSGYGKQEVVGLKMNHRESKLGTTQFIMKKKLKLRSQIKKKHF